MGFIDNAKEISKSKVGLDRPTLKTELDTIIQVLQKPLKKNQIIKSTGIKKIDTFLQILEKQKIIKIDYPINFFSEPKITLLEIKGEKKEEDLPSNKELIDSYNINVDNVNGSVNIYSTPKEDVPIYELLLPNIGTGTKGLIKYLINEMASELSMESSNITDPEKNEQIKQDLIKKTSEKLKKICNLSEQDNLTIAGMVVHDMYGLGEMEIMMGDNWLEEIAINGSRVPVSVYHKRLGWTKTTVFLENEQEIYNFASQMGRKVGRQINSLNPLMDAHLITGDRVAATLQPISSSGNTITIRRFSRNPWTIVHLVDPKIGTMSVEIAAFLWLCIQYELNIMIAGGTASGKTSVLNSIASLIPATQRILSIEDTRELALPDALHWNWVPMSSRKPNPEGQGGVTMLDLMVESLRMRPDRIIVGEIRRREQAETLFETMHTGHSVYTTMHADTVEQVQRRLIEPPIEIPKTEIGSLHLVVIEYRDRRKGARRTLEVAEILNQEGDEKSLSLNYLYKWRPRDDSFEKVNNSMRVMEELNLHTGMTTKDIENNLREKEDILNWMVQQQIRDVDVIGKIMKIYYKNPEQIIQAARNNLDPLQVVK